MLCGWHFVRGKMYKFRLSDDVLPPIVTRKNLTQEAIKRYFTYDREAGHFTRNFPTGRFRKGSAVHGYKKRYGVYIGLKMTSILYWKLIHLYEIGFYPIEIDVIFKNGDQCDFRWGNLKFTQKKTDSSVTANKATRIKNRNELTQELLMLKFTYDSEIGRFRRNHTAGNAKKHSVINGYQTDKSLVMSIDRIRFVYSHIVWLYHTGELPLQPLVHINGDRYDVRHENLKLEHTCDIKNKDMKAKLKIEYVDGRKKVSLYQGGVDSEDSCKTVVYKAGQITMESQSSPGVL